MLFNSYIFLVFLVVVFLIYWLVLGKRFKAQNLFLVLASYLFYGWWSYEFLSLILISTLVDYLVGIQISRVSAAAKRRLWLMVSMSTNLGILGFFKYYNFFVENLIEAFESIGMHPHLDTLHIILPVGISFYTFQTMSYTIDVYRNKLEPTRDAIAFAAYVCFFPQLVAGPIERATNLLPQFQRQRRFNFDVAKDGVKQVLWGMFKKVVIADSCAYYVDLIFDAPDGFNSLFLGMAVVLFAFQIYCDFSGYSDIALGLSKLLGFNIMVNFKTPYFSRDIGEFWRRWHISLSTWFRDYLYIPLGGSRGSELIVIRNILAIFIVSGFWHGANWTFIIWGAINALMFLPLILSGTNRNNVQIDNHRSLWSKESIGMVLTFSLTCAAWVFFRSESVSEAIGFFASGLSNWSVSSPINFPLPLIVLIIFLLVVEWYHQQTDHPLVNLRLSKIQKTILYLVIFVLTAAHFEIASVDFIYFQF